MRWDRFLTILAIVFTGAAPAVAQSNPKSPFLFHTSNRTLQIRYLLPWSAIPSAAHSMIEGGTPAFAYVDDFSGYIKTDFTNVPDSLVPMSGQVSPSGIVSQGDLMVGAATLAVMQAGGASHPVGESPTYGPIECFMAVARDTANDPYNPIISPASNERFGTYSPSIGEHVLIVQDAYVASDDDQPRTNGWWAPGNFQTAQLLDRVYFGGTNIGPDFGWAENDDELLDHFVSIGPCSEAPCDAPFAEFYASNRHNAFPFPVNKWFTMAVHLDRTAEHGMSYSLWVKTPDTVAADPPFIDPRLVSGDIATADGDPDGWINVYPGYPDDDATADVIEGIGIAQRETGELASTNGAFGQDSITNSPFARTEEINGIQIGEGLDDHADNTYEASDVFYGPLRIRGPEIAAPCLPDLSLNFVVDAGDLEDLLSDWGKSNVQADFNQDGVVDGSDLAMMLASWGPCS